jgi:spore maturation protein CgeB
VGVLYRYQKRITLLKKIVENFSKQKINIIGKYKPIEKNIYKWMLRERRDIYTNKNVDPVEVNRLYNQSRVVLNIHHETQIEGANPKVFEIAASCIYQICDHNPYIASLFPNGEVGLYKNEQEMFQLIEDALRNDKSEQAKKAQEIVLNNHTYLHRVKEMLTVALMKNK